MYAIIPFHYLELLRTRNKSIRIIFWFPSFYCIDTFLFHFFHWLINFSPITFFFFFFFAVHQTMHSTFQHFFILMYCHLWSSSCQSQWPFLGSYSLFFSDSFDPLALPVFTETVFFAWFPFILSPNSLWSFLSGLSSLTPGRVSASFSDSTVS